MWSWLLKSSCSAGLFSTMMLMSGWTGVVQKDIPVAQTEDESLAQVAKDFNQPSTDAKVDRVWHAIPGLEGWQLDSVQSSAATKQAGDGKLHLVWRTVSPKVKLNDLPPEPVYRGPKEEKSVSLMVNVSWGEEYLPSMLQTLKENHVKATFFLDGAWVKKNRDLARKLVEEGQDIGSHGSNHPDFRKLSDGQLSDQVVGTNQILYQTLGVRPKCIAPPSGSYDGRFVRIAKNHGMYTILWTADTVDWQRPKPEVIIERVRQNAEPGALILMHPTEPTAKALPILLKMLRDQGYQMKTVDDVIQEHRVVKPPATLSVRG